MLATLYFTLREISPMGQTGYNGKGGRGGKGALVIEEARNEDEEAASEQEGVCVCVCVCVCGRVGVGCVCTHICPYARKHVCRVGSVWVCVCVWGVQMHSLAQILGCVLVGSCASAMSTQRADLDDKRVILPCWVGHLKDSHFSGSSMEGSMREREGWTGRMLGRVSVCVCVCCVCGAEEKKENTNCQWGQSNKDHDSSWFSYTS